jgi:hypothetical protein
MNHQSPAAAPGFFIGANSIFQILLLSAEAIPRHACAG